MNWRFNHLVWRVLPGVLTSLVCAALVNLGAFEPLENLAYNTLFRIRGERSWDDRLLLVTIDDASIQQLGRFPWPRRRYAEFLGLLSKGNLNNVVVFDLFFSEPSQDDAQFVEAMTNHGQVVLAMTTAQNRISLSPTPTLLDAAIAVGHASHVQASDGVTRKVPFEVQNNVTLGVVAVQAYSLTQEKVVPPKRSDFYWVNWPGSVQNIPQVSFVDVIQQKIPTQRFQNKIILLGVTATGIDPLVTPFNQNPSANGVHLHAAITNNLLQQSFLAPPSDTVVFGVLVLGGPLLGVVLSRKRERDFLLLWFSGVVFWSALSILLFQVGYWVPVVLPIGLMTLTASLTWSSDRLRLDARLREQIQQLWQTYKTDVVLRKTKPLMQSDSLPDAYASQSINRLAALADLFGRSQSAQAAIARSLPIGLIAVDLDGWVWFCNPIATEWLNIQVGDYFTDQLIPHWLTQKELQGAIQNLNTSAIQFSKILRQDDSWFEVKLEPLQYQLHQTDQADNASTPDGMLILIEDVTVQKKAELVLEQQVQELQRLSQLKDDFLSTVSHELRSPMTNIYMAIEMLKIAKSSESSAHYLKILQAECAREIDLINDLLDLQRLEAGVHNFQLENIDVEDWLPPVIEPFYKRAEAQDQTLEIEVNDQLSPLVSDQSSLERVVVELITNACKYTPPNGRITVEVSSNQSSLIFAVSNSGSEIPKTELLRIFEKFYRVPHADPWKRGGTGLGLALVKKLVERLGGTIQVSSGSGRTTFTVQLPLTHPEISGL